MTLILPDGYKKWSANADAWSFNQHDQPKPRDTGYPVEYAIAKHIEDQARLGVEPLPPNFCPDCNRTDIPVEKAQAIGLWCFLDNYPEINVQKNQTLVHYKCIDCMNNELWTSKLHLPHSAIISSKLSRQKRMENNIIEFLKAERLRGKFYIFRNEPDSQIT